MTPVPWVEETPWQAALRYAESIDRREATLTALEDDAAARVINMEIAAQPGLTRERADELYEQAKEAAALAWIRSRWPHTWVPWHYVVRVYGEVEYMSATLADAREHARRIRRDNPKKSVRLSAYRTEWWHGEPRGADPDEENLGYD